MATVLVIDDEQEARELWRDLLAAEGHDVQTAETGNEGLEAALERAFDVIVTDILMPEKDGIETLMELRNEGVRSRVIAVSGGGVVVDTSFLDVASKLGANLTLTKPVDPSELCREVSRLADMDPVRQAA